MPPKALAPEPRLTPGNGFFLQGDGTWGVLKIPPEVLAQAKFSGHLTIQGYLCSVFEMPDSSQWAQRSSEPVVLASVARRVAAKFK